MMKPILSARLFRVVLLFATAAILGVSSVAFAQSGEVTKGNITVEPAIDDTTGNGVFILETTKSPFPVTSSPTASAPLYAVQYPIESSVPAADLNCQPDNCDHDNVLPFPDPDYGMLPGTDAACQAFNGGQPCSPIKGHDHLIGVAPTGGDFNVAWQIDLVIFTSKGFADGAINTRITTLSQLQSLVTNNEVMIVQAPITFLCAVVSQQVYDAGTPEVIPYP